MSKSWPRVRLGGVLREEQERAGTFDADGVPLLGVSNVGGLHRSEKPRIADMSRYLRVEHRWFAYNPMRINVGSVGWAEHEEQTGVISPDYVVFSCTDRVEPKLLYLFLRSGPGLQAINAETAGSVRERLYFESLARIAIPLPPRDEQRRVVARIEELVAKIHEAHILRRQAIEEARTLHHQQRHRVFRCLPCPRAPIGELFDLVNGRSFRPEEWQDTGRPIIRIQNLKYPTAPYNRYQGFVDPRHLVHEGDILFAWSGQVVSLGAHIWRGEEGVLNQHIFNVRGRCEFVPEFVSEAFNALLDDMKRQVRGLEMFHIRKQELDKLPFPVLSVPEQRRIVAELDALRAVGDQLRQLQAETATEVDSLLPAILDRAFKGEL